MTYKELQEYVADCNHRLNTQTLTREQSKELVFRREYYNHLYQQQS